MGQDPVVRLLPLLLLLAGCVVTPAQDDDDASSEPTPAPPFGFALPLPDASRISTLIGVDHDPEEHEGTAGALYCRNYAGEPFPTCYDGHDGSDFILDGGFPAMASDPLPVLAAADGVVILTEDGNYDLCHGENFEVSCDGHPIRANKVHVEHDSGLRSHYLHLMIDSVAVEEGDEVVCGQHLGFVGSSGRSSTPHLHFEVQDADGVSYDPFAVEPDERLWREQNGGWDQPAPDCGPGS